MYENLLEKVEAFNQGHLLKFWDELSENEKKNLADEISEINFEQISKLVDKYIKHEVNDSLPENFEAADYYPHTAEAELEGKYAQARQLGEKLIREGKVAGFVVAGGQGTRLGFDGPKGSYPISPVRNKSLFRIFGETIAAVNAKYNTNCPWYVMTSPLNHEATVKFFEENDFFGLKKSDIFIFKQGTMPNFSFEGKILMSDKCSIAKSPDGHGGSLKALYMSGALEDMKRRGVEHISYWQVDNPLIEIFDPLFVGLHAMSGSQMSSKTLMKSGPMEKVGNFCKVDGRIFVIEYSDLPDEMAEKRNPDGSLVFRLGSIAIHIISREFVEQINSGDFSLGFHKAIKKIKHIDPVGNKVEPEEPNGIKLESFIFDAIPMAENSIILETMRQEEFGPVKNASGVDSAETSRQLQIERAARWLEQAGIEVPRKENGEADCVVEIAPSFAICTDDVKAKADKIGTIEPGSEIYIE